MNQRSMKTFGPRVMSTPPRVQLAATALAAAAFVPPATVDGFRSFLVGPWTLRKVMQYQDGAPDGRFAGSAVFFPFSKSLLAYNESGMFTPKDSSAAPMETRNNLLFQCLAESLDVFFDPVGHDRSSNEAIVNASRYLYSLTPREPGVLAIESTADGDDTYDGTLEVSARDAFLLTWRVRGKVNGEILSLFSRSDDVEL